MGLYLCQGRVSGATMPSAYRLGLDITNMGVLSGEDLHAVSAEWGGTMVVLGVAALDASVPTPTMDLERGCKFSYQDRLSSRYFRNRFEPEFPESLKTLLLLIEGDLNTAQTFLPLTAAGYEYAVFRAHTITLYHSLTAVHRVLERHPSIDTASTQKLRDLLADAPTLRLLSNEGRQVRNRCMHYELKDPAVRIVPSIPMFGIVEAVYPGNTWARFERDVVLVSRRLADLLHGWKPTRRSR